MTHKVTELQVLGDALGLELVDELSTYQERFDKLKGSKDLEKVAFLMPLMNGLLEAAAQDRSSVHGWCLSGQYDHVRVNIRAITTGQHGHPGTQLQAFFDPPLQLGLKITNEALFSRFVQKLTGKHDIQTGNQELDKAIHIEAQDVDATRRLLANSDVQQTLFTAYAKYPWPMITDAFVEVDHYGFINDADALRKSLELLTHIVTILTGRTE